MAFETVYIQVQGDRSLLIEEQLVFDYAQSKGVNIEFYTPKNINRRNLPLTVYDLVVGDVKCVEGAMKQLGVPVPAPNSYPNSLKHYLHRDLWTMTVGELECRLRDGLNKPVFAKPADKLKTFTGRVFHSEVDLYYLHGISRTTRLLCTDVVSWLSEYRVYVVNDEIRHVAYCDGDGQSTPSMTVIKKAVEELCQAGEGYDGFCIDFGVLSTGQTALLELNEGYAIGAYSGISYQDYGELIFARWQQLINNHN